VTHPATSKPASPSTRAQNESEKGRVFDPADLERVRRGFIAARTEPDILDEEGRTAIRTSAYDFLRDGRESPDTVNPHLWRHAVLNAHHGLFEVAPSVWQVRGYDISNVTFIAGATGWVVIDPLTSAVTARASLDLDLHALARRSLWWCVGRDKRGRRDERSMRDRRPRRLYA
jgi:alkyl sulfatase BDS1-like metallo-beta-lactamase superfamily hydrolase